ncbi:hypothetical protein JCM10207_006192 [Rhodosporidiobolus poonsookiae]
MKDEQALDDQTKSLYEPFYVRVQRNATLHASFGGDSAPAANSFGSGLLTRLGKAQSSLTIETAEDVVYLRPPPLGVPEPGQDEVLKGTVVLYLPKSRKLRHLSARMLGRYDLSWPDSTSQPYENGVLFERTIELLPPSEDDEKSEGLELDKGTHTFEFAFIVPANSACWERSPHGRVRYSVSARSRSFTTLGGDLATPEKPVYLIPNPVLSHADPSSLGMTVPPPPPLQLYSEGIFADTGPYAIELMSQHITVGGLLLLRFYLPSPPQDLFLHSIKVSLKETFHLSSPDDPSRRASIPETTHTVCILSSSAPPNSAQMSSSGRGAPRRDLSPSAAPLARVPSGEGIEVVHLARMPNDNHLRPTTMEGSETPIRVEAGVDVEVLYREWVDGDEELLEKARGEGERAGSKEREKARAGSRKGKERQRVEVPELRKLKLSKPIELFSCLNFLDSLTLPRYTQQDPNPLSAAAHSDGVDLKVPCVCGMTLKQLLQTHASRLLTFHHQRATSAAYARCPAFEPPVFKDDDERAAMTPSATGWGRWDAPEEGSEREGGSGREGDEKSAG